VKNKDEVIAFLTSDIVRMEAQPVYQAGYKEGYLTKRGKNFGGWKTRYFVLNGPVLEYYESRGGAHLGSIAITGAQIGRQQPKPGPRSAGGNSSAGSGGGGSGSGGGGSGGAEDDNEYRHAFLVIEAKKGPGGSQTRHVLCAESDAERDSWVQVLVRYVGGSYSEDGTAAPAYPSSIASSSTAVSSSAPKSSLSLDEDPMPARRMPPPRGMSKDNIVMGPAVPISQLAPDASHAKLMQAAPYPEALSAPEPAPAPAPDGKAARRIFEVANPGVESGMSASLPSGSPLDGGARAEAANHGARSNSELGWYADAPPPAAAASHPAPQPPAAPPAPAAPEPSRADRRKSYHPSMGPVRSEQQQQQQPPAPAPAPRAATPEAPASQAARSEGGRAKISGPIGGVPIPAGFKFGGSNASSAAAQSQDSLATTSGSDRREKAKSRSFWGFGGRSNGVYSFWSHSANTRY
jgi:RalA-binding protein 1